jgi:hypothetical protein
VLLLFADFISDALASWLARHSSGRTGSPGSSLWFYDDARQQERDKDEARHLTKDNPTLR